MATVTEHFCAQLLRVALITAVLVGLLLLPLRLLYQGRALLAE